MFGSPRCSCQFRHGGRTPQLLDEAVYFMAELQIELLDTTRCSHRPSTVPEVALELSDYALDRERAESHTTLGIEAVDCLDECQRADLNQVVMWFAAIGKAARKLMSKAEMRRDDLVA